MAGAIAENFGYRQWIAFVRAKAWWTVLRPARGWGEMTRVGFAERPPAPRPEPAVLEPARAPEPEPVAA
jgi:hypothetical protein